MADGFVPLTDDIVNAAIAAGQKLRVIAKLQNDWMVTSFKNVCRPIANCKGELFLLPPRARNRGYSLSALRGAYVKIA